MQRERETKLNVDDAFQKKADTKIESEKNSGQKEPEWQIVRRRRRAMSEGKHVTDDESLKDSDSPGSFNGEDSLFFVDRRKRRRTDEMKIDGREAQEHKRDKIIAHKTDEDKKERREDLEQEICVITWNVHESSAQYDFLRDMAQCQANVVIFQETQKWQTDGTADGLGWTLLKEKKEGKAATAVKMRKSNFMRHCRKSTRWILVVLGSILSLSMYLPRAFVSLFNCTMSDA